MMPRLPHERHPFSKEISSLRFQNGLNSGLGQLPGQPEEVHSYTFTSRLSFFVPFAISAAVKGNSSVVVAHSVYLDPNHHQPEIVWEID